jgi:fatty acid desaturase
VSSTPLNSEQSIDSAHGVVVDADLLEQLYTANHRSLVQCFVFLTLYVVSAATILQLHSGTTVDALVVVGCLPLYLIAAASLHGISLFTHEAVHGVLSRNHSLNRIFGIACALPVLQNFSAYKVLHLKHHQYLGHEGDPDHYDNYSRWTWLVFSMHWLRLIVGYPVYIVMIPILGFRQGTVTERCWIVLEVALLCAGIAAAVMSFSWHVLLHAWLIPMVMINTLVNIRGMSQHTFLEEPDDPIRGTRSILTNPVTEFFMCNENYHLEHHLFPRVPWYHLKRLHQAIKGQLTDREAPFVKSYFEFVCEFTRKSWQRSPLGRLRKRV